MSFVKDSDEPTWQEIAQEIDASVSPAGDEALAPLLSRLRLDMLTHIAAECAVHTVADLWRLGTAEGAAVTLRQAGAVPSELIKMKAAFYPSHLARERARLRQQRREAAAREGVAMPTGSQGGLYAPRFVAAVQSLYDLHMGVENMAPLLYALVRFIKPRQVLEIGAGYTSIFVLQALADNRRELQQYAALQRCDLCTVGDTTAAVPWCVEGLAAEVEALEAKAAAAKAANSRAGGAAAEARLPGAGAVALGGAGGVLHCVDNMAHAHTTAHRVAQAADKLGVADHLNLIVRDAWVLELRRDGQHFDSPVSAGGGVEPGGGGAGDGTVAGGGAVGDRDAAGQIGKEGGAEGGGEEDREGPFLDMLWVDFGAGKHLDSFFAKWWPKLRRGGHAIVHSTVTNSFTRKWLEAMRRRGRGLPAESGASRQGPDAAAQTQTSSAASPVEAVVQASVAASGVVVDGEESEGSVGDHVEVGGLFDEDVSLSSMSDSDGAPSGAGGGCTAGVLGGCGDRALSSAAAVVAPAAAAVVSKRGDVRRTAPSTSAVSAGRISAKNMEFETVSFYEPHKMFQNSFSIFQKRGGGYGEPVLTRYP